MAKGINIAIGADTRAYADAVRRGLIDPTEEAAEALEDFGRSGPRDIERVEDAMQDAQRQTEDVKAELKELAAELRETGRKSRSDFADPVNRSARDVGDQLDEVTGEAKQNAAEMFSSFDGSFESIADAAQGTLGGLVGGLKGIPAIAAVAAGAAGLGLVSQEIISQIDKAEQLKENLMAAYQAAAEEGRTYLTTAQIVAEATDIFFNPERKGELENFRKEAEKIGVDVNTYVAAMAGDYDALTFAIEKAAEAEAERRQQLLDEGASLGSVDALLNNEGWSRLTDQLEGLGDQHLTNRDNAREYASFVEQMTRQERENIERVRSAEQDRWDGLAQRAQEAASAPPVTIKTELAAPDPESVRRGAENEFSRRPLKVRATLVNREGKELTG